MFIINVVGDAKRKRERESERVKVRGWVRGWGLEVGARWRRRNVTAGVILKKNCEREVDNQGVFISHPSKRCLPATNP